MPGLGGAVVTESCAIRSELPRSPDATPAIPEPNLLAFEYETRVKIRVSDQPAARSRQFFETGEGSEADLPVSISHAAPECRLT